MNRSLPNMAASMSKVFIIVTIKIKIFIVTNHDWGDNCLWHFHNYYDLIFIGQAPKIYPIHLLMTSNYRLPNDADR